MISDFGSQSILISMLPVDYPHKKPIMRIYNISKYVE